jgi:hypothetical protein
MKTLLALLLLGVAGFILSRVFPPYFANSQLADKIKSEAKFAQASERTPEQLRANILRTALELEIPINSDQIRIEMDPQGTHITADYTVPVDLYYHQVDWAFHISSDGD